MSDQRLRTGELAERAGVNVQTLRYYERHGLLAAPTRRPSGEPEYSDDAVRLLRTIKAAQRLGIHPGRDRGAARPLRAPALPDELLQQAQAKVAEIDAKIDQLTRDA